jgi:hypothetical protein
MTAAIAVTMTAAVVVPTVVASAPLLGPSTERGELAAVRDLCDALPIHGAVLITGVRASDEWPQVIRGDCGVPVAVLPATDDVGSADVVANAARAHGLDPVVVADSKQGVTSLTTAMPQHVVHLVTRESDHQLTHRPSRTRALVIDVWLGIVAP